MSGDAIAAQLDLALTWWINPTRRRRAVASDPAPVADAAEDGLQLVLDLAGGLLADTPPYCRCCQRRGCLPLAGGGWTRCTWCEGTLVDPAAMVVWLRRQPGRPLPALERLAS